MNFVIVDLDKKRSPAQQELVRKYYQGYIPHVTVLNQKGDAVYDSPGEVDEAKITHVLDQVLK